MESTTLKAERRTDLGTLQSRRLRETGRLPGIIYGHGKDPEAFSVSAHDVAMELQHGARIVALDLGGASDQYLIKEIQYDHLDRYPIHIDLARIDMNERVQVKVAVELRGTPQGLHEGGILDSLMDSIEIECLASQIPATLHPSVAHLGVGESLLVKDIELPDGVTSISNPDDKVAMVHVLATKAAVEDAETEEDAGPAQPERIGRVAESEEDNKKND